MIESGKIHVIGGASQCGKTSWTRGAVKRSRRVIAWDPEDQWAELPGWKKVTTRAELLKSCQTAGPMKIAYVAGGDLPKEFDFWAGVVMYAVRYYGPLDCIGEELADVSTVGKAPANWGIVIRRGLKRGLTIYAISQRWQEADKTAIGNATDFILFRQNGPEAGKYLERKTGVPFFEIPVQDFEFIVWSPKTQTFTRGKTTK